MGPGTFSEIHFDAKIRKYLHFYKLLTDILELLHSLVANRLPTRGETQRGGGKLKKIRLGRRAEIRNFIIFGVSQNHESLLFAFLPPEVNFFVFLGCIFVFLYLKIVQL